MSPLLLQQLIFYLFATVAVVSAVMVVTLNNPVRCALSLVMTFVASAGIWIMAQTEFLALILLLVYVGAVMTLFLFVVMMLDIDVASMKRRFVRYLPVGAFVVGLLVFLMFVAIRPENFGFAHLTKGLARPPDFSNVAELGKVLYTQYAFPFELAAVLLLVAIVAGIALSHRGPRNCKTQNPVAQIRVNAADRIRLVSMEVESDSTD